MRLPVLSALAVALLASCGLPPNLPVADGVAAYDRSTGGFWVNGKPYILPPDLPTDGVMSGDEVRVFYEQQGDQRLVTRIEVTERMIFRM